MSSSRFGIIALEFPPQIGGMEEHARGVAEALSATDHVVVYTRPGNGVANAQFEQRAVITGDLVRDWEVLREENVDIWLGLNAGYVALAPRLKAPMFAYFHGNDFLNPWVATKSSFAGLLRRLPYFWRYADPCQVFLRRRAITHGAKSARHIFANSKNTKHLIRRIFRISDGFISVIPPGIDPCFFQRGSASQTEPVRILTVCRLSKLARRKNVDGVLRALATLRGDVSFTYTIIGDGDDRSYIESLSHELGLQSLVRFTGWIDHDGLLAAYRNADMFILAAKASDLDVEGFGIGYIEAAAAGVPSICSAEGGSADAVLQGISGIIIPDSSPDSIAKGIRDFCESRSQFSPERIRAFAEQFRRPKLVADMRARMIAELERNGD